MQPIIGVTVGEAVNKDYPITPKIQGQQFTYINALARAGATPILLPLVHDDKTLQQLYALCDGLLFAGGNDLSPGLYGAERSPRTRHTFPLRDDQEVKLMKWALDDDKPVLAICRGMQLLNVVLGGTLYQDIETELPGAELHMDMTDAAKDPYFRTAHKLKLLPDSRVAELLGTESVGTNAYHHQAIRDLGEGLIATGWAPDDVIEAVELPEKRFVLGVQSHPEALEAEVEPRWRQVFGAFVDSARS